MEKIFLLEDDPALARGIGMALEAPGRAVTLAGTLGESRPAAGWTCCVSCGGRGTAPR